MSKAPKTHESIAAARPVRVALYTRVSTDIQAGKEEGSLDTQEARLRSNLDGRGHAYVVRYVFREEGESGKSLDRPEVQRMLAAVRSREIDLVIVTRIDRLSRSVLDFYEVHRLFKSHGVQFVSLNETFDTSSAVGRAMLKLVLVFAELEREQTAERTRVAMHARAERGLWNGGHPPLGYDSRGNGHLDTNAAEVELVRLIFGKYLELRSTVKLAAWLNDQGLRQKSFSSRRKGNTGGKVFTFAVLQGMLANRLYLGEIEHKGEVFKGQHAAIVGNEVFERVAQILADNDKNLRISPERAKYEYLLTGTLRCECGYALTPSAGRGKGKSYFYYRCVGKNKNDRHVCPVKQVRADKAEAVVLEIVRDTARNPELIAESIAAANRLAKETVAPRREHVLRMRSELAAAQRSADQLLDALLAAGATESQTAKGRLADSEARIAQLRRALDEAEGDLAARENEQLDAEVMVQAIRSFDEAYDFLTLDEKREFLRLMLKRVEIHRDRVIVHLYEGRRATASLVGVVAARKEASPEQQNPDVNPGFVNETKWLPNTRYAENVFRDARRAHEMQSPCGS